MISSRRRLQQDPNLQDYSSQAQSPGLDDFRENYIKFYLKFLNNPFTVVFISILNSIITFLLLPEKILKKREEKKLKERGDLAGKAKMPGSPLSPSPSSSISSVSTVSLSPTEIFAYEEEQRLKANLPPLGSPKSVSPRLSPLGRGRGKGMGMGMGVGAQARRKSSTSSSSSSKSPKKRKLLTPRFEKVEATSVSPKARGKGKGKEGTKHEGGAGRTRKKYKCKLRKNNSRRRHH